MAKFRCMGCMQEFDDTLTVCPHCGYEKGTPAKEIYHMPPESILSGRYIIGRVLGFGGFGITYIAWDAVLEKPVAVKEYLPSDFATRIPGQTQVSVYEGEKEEQFTAGLKSFIEESQRLAKFNTVDGIVNIYDSFVENKTAYIIMEYLDGRTLKSILKEKGKISYEEAVGYALPILYALEEVHAAGIIHRDIAPDNIFITNDGRVKLLDFGAARYATTLHSKSLSVILKPGYAPEEQYRTRGNQGPWSDVYAMAATIYRAITGVVPQEALDRAAKDEVKEPSKLGVSLPKNLENAIMNALNIKAENRIQSAKEFADALAGEVTLERVIIKQKKEDVGKWPLWQKGLLGGAVAAVVAVVVLIATGVIQTPLTRERLPNVIEMSIEEAEAALAPYGYNYMDEAETIEMVSQDDPAPAEPAATPVKTAGSARPVVANLAFQALPAEIEEPAGEPTSEDAAQNEEAASAYKIRIENKVYDSAIPENMILAQSPNAGSRVNKGKYPDVYLVLSAGAEEVYLPEESLVGLSREDAVAKLEALGLVVQVLEAQSAEYAPGYVLAQGADPETKLRKGDSITITVSTGSNGEKIATTVPNVVGKTFDDAKQMINAASLYVALQSSEYSDTVPKDCVISQTPGAGSSATTNETLVMLVVSKGSASEATTRVPDVTNVRLETATKTLANRNLKNKVLYAYSNTIASGTVISQDINPDTKVVVGTTVTLVVSKGAKDDSTAQIEQATKREEERLTETTREQTTRPVVTEPPSTTVPTTADTRIRVPSVVGGTEASARSALQDFTVAVQYGYCDSVSSGRVITQSLSSGTRVNAGTKITITVSVGSKASNWTSWSTTYPSSGLNIESKSQYRYATRSTKTVYGSWSGTSWSFSQKSTSDTCQYMGTGTAYTYYHFTKPRVTDWSFNGPDYSPTYNSTYPEYTYTEYVTYNHTMPWVGKGNGSGRDIYGGSGYGCSQCGICYWYPNRDHFTRTVYGYQTRSKWTEYTAWSGWSGWYDGTTSGNDLKQVQTRQVYRSCPKYPTYNSSGGIIG